MQIRMIHDRAVTSIFQDPDFSRVRLLRMLIQNLLGGMFNLGNHGL